MSRFSHSSQEIVDILIREGFVDVTEKMNKQHYDRLLERGYNPDNVKRYFQIPESPYSYVHFDYINISLGTKDGQYLFHWKPLSAEQLKGIIAFCKLPNIDQREFAHSSFNVLEIPEVISKMDEPYTFYRRAIHKRLKANYDSTNLN